MSVPNLIRMANNIALNLAAYPDDVASSKIRQHLGSFWEPRMLEKLQTYIDNDAPGLNPTVRQAALGMRDNARQ